MKRVAHIKWVAIAVLLVSAPLSLMLGTPASAQQGYPALAQEFTSAIDLRVAAFSGFPVSGASAAILGLIEGQADEIDRDSRVRFSSRFHQRGCDRDLDAVPPNTGAAHTMVVGDVHGCSGGRGN